MTGGQSVLKVGIVAVLIGVILGVALGLAAASRGGCFESLAMRISDLLFAFPVVLLAIMLAAGFGPGSVTSMVAIGIHNVPIFARLTRAGAKAIWAREFVMAARAAGTDALQQGLAVLLGLRPLLRETRLCLRGAGYPRALVLRRRIRLPRERGRRRRRHDDMAGKPAVVRRPDRHRGHLLHHCHPAGPCRAPSRKACHAGAFRRRLQRLPPDDAPWRRLRIRHRVSILGLHGPHRQTGRRRPPDPRPARRDVEGPPQNGSSISRCARAPRRSG